MTVVRLTSRAEPGAPVGGHALDPGRLCRLPEGEIAGVALRRGTGTAAVGDLFRVETEGEPGDGPARLEIRGDLTRFERLGEGMDRGELVVEGGAGDHLGAGMSGGSITVRGSAGSWCGAEMTGGTIRVGGDVGARAGAAYPGSRHGMNRGVILVEGDAGPHLGEAMRRGLVAVRGRAGPHVGAHMVAGSLFVLGGCRGPIGAGMRRGTILTTGEPELLPGFRYACTYRPTYLRFYLRRLRSAHGFAVRDALEAGPYRRFSGDFTELGRGEILLLDE